MPEPSTTSLLTQAALDNATGQLREEFQERLQRDADRLVRITVELVEELLTRAYVDGVRDGFVQGAEAQARTEGAEKLPVTENPEEKVARAQEAMGRARRTIEELRAENARYRRALDAITLCGWDGAYAAVVAREAVEDPGA